ncbi:hypothetical protein ACFE04_021926 [Oxalis oulophora]
MIQSPEQSASEEDEDDDEDRKIVKKRKIDLSDYDDEEIEIANEDYYYDREEEPEGKSVSKQHVSAPEMPLEFPARIPLPDKKTMEFILHKLQKKDTYGVFSEPVDPEELPDYHEVIEHPMDFATVRKKLGNDSYLTLEQFEHCLGEYGPVAIFSGHFLLSDKSLFCVYVPAIPGLVGLSCPDCRSKPNAQLTHPFLSICFLLSSQNLFSDILLLCSNAMQYNAPDTVYYKQANTIQELAKRKFQKLRINFVRSEREIKSSEKEIKSSEKEMKTEQKQKSVFLDKKQLKKPFSLTMPEPLGSDFSSGATLATVGEVPNGSNAAQAGGLERPSNNDGIVDGNTTMVDNSMEKIEELSSGKGFLSKLGRRSSVIDENRRSTYSTSCEPAVKPGSIFTTFEGEIKQLVAVGLQAEYAYARSLARFAAFLGPVAWKVASKQIEQAVPSGCKFGRGWVGEYEPLPTPVLMIESTNRQESTSFTKTQTTVEVPKRENLPCYTPSPRDRSVNGRSSDGQPSFFRPPAGSTSEKKPYFSRPTTGPSEENKFSSHAGNATHKQRNTQSRTAGEPANRCTKQVELNFPPSATQNNSNNVAEKQQSKKSASRPRETLPRNVNAVHPVTSQPLDNNGIIAGGLPKKGAVLNTYPNNNMPRPPSEGIPNQLVRPTMYSPLGQEQGLTDPFKLMKMLSKEIQSETLLNTTAPKPVKREDSGNAAAAAARAWMSIGAGGFKQPTENPNSPRNQISAESLYNPAREFPQQMSRVRAESPLPMQFQAGKNNIPFQPFAPQPVRPGNEQNFPNRPMMFPQFVGTADFSRFQMQSPWTAGLGQHVQPGMQSPRTQPRQKQETLPPDLNIGFQHPGSPPVKQSSGVFVDSQQPDLALQL